MGGRHRGRQRRVPGDWGADRRPFNNRYELDLKNRSKLRLYLSGVDHRFHLYGADRAWLKVDYNFDGKPDMAFRYKDSDGDGIIDTWEVDYDGDGTIDYRTHIADAKWAFVPRAYASMTSAYNSILDTAIRNNQSIIESMKRVLEQQEQNYHTDAVEEYFLNDLPKYRESEGIGRKIRDSRAGTRYYQDLIRERYFARVGKLLESKPRTLKEWRSAYDRGDYPGATRILDSYAPAGPKWTADWQPGFEKRLTLRVSNPSSLGRKSEAIIIDVKRIKRYASDFNPHNFAIYSGARQITDRELPSQADDLDGDGAPEEIVFSTDLGPQETAVFRICYSPTGNRHNLVERAPAVHAKQTSADLLEWASEKVTYQLSQGRLQFHMELPSGEKMAAPLAESKAFGIEIGEIPASTHAFLPYQADSRIISSRIIANGPVRAIVGVKLDLLSAGGARSHVEERFSTYAGQSFSENRISVDSPKSRVPLWANIASMQTRDNQNFFDAPLGYFGSWYRQNNITQEIGSAVVLAQPVAKAQTIASTHQVLVPLTARGDLTWYVR